MNDKDLQSFLEKEMVSEGMVENSAVTGDNQSRTHTQITENRMVQTATNSKKKTTHTNLTGRDSLSNDSEVTIYHKAVRQLSPELELKIEDFLNKSRSEVTTECS